MSSTSRARICMLVHNNYDEDPRVRRYVRALVDAGADVDVLCPRVPSQSATFRLDGARVYTIPASHGRHSRPGSYLWEYSLAMILYCVRLNCLCLRNRYHIIHIHNMPDSLILVSLLPRLLGTRLILDIHDPMPDFYMSRHEAERGNMVVGILRSQERTCAALADRVITANPAFETALIRRGIPPRKVTVINNFPDAALFDRDRYARERLAPREDFRLIYPGTIAPRYGLDLPIRALPALRHSIPNIRLRIMGKRTDYGDRLTALAEELGVAGSFELTPGVPVDQVPRLMATADVGIYPALPGPHMDIAVPGKVLEYAVMGLPVISARVGAVEGSFPPSCVLFFEPGNVEQFTQCVLELYRNPARRAELVQNMDREYVKEHSWHVERTRYLDLLNQLLPATTRIVPRAG